jgi:hypothetical protein
MPLVAVLAAERPQHYWESHAGNATYEMVDDAERRFGALRFVEVAPQFPLLAASGYAHHLAALNSSGPLTVYPGGPGLAMLELGADGSYLFCDVDGGSVDNLHGVAARLGLDGRVRVVAADGMTTLHEAIGTRGKIVAHVDPYDPWAEGPSGLSALSLGRELIEHEVALVYWYGYDHPQQRAWAFDALSDACPTRRLWCGDVLVTTAHGAVHDDGNLGDATTPGTGFGVVLANVSDTSIATCSKLGEQLSRAYAGVPLPDATPGGLDFRRRLRPASSAP